MRYRAEEREAILDEFGRSRLRLGGIIPPRLDAEGFAKNRVFAQAAVYSGGVWKQERVGGTEVFAEVHLPRQEFMAHEAGELLALAECEGEIQFKIVEEIGNTVSEGRHGKLHGSETLEDATGTAGGPAFRDIGGEWDMDHEEFPHAGILFGEFVGGKEHRTILTNRDDYGEFGFQLFQNIVHMMALKSPREPVAAAGMAIDDDHFMVIDQIHQIMNGEGILQIQQYGGQGEFLL